MALHVLGINHQTAPVSLREKVAFAPESLAPALASLRALPEVHEAVLLSNRVHPTREGTDVSELRRAVANEALRPRG